MLVTPGNFQEALVQVRSEPSPSVDTETTGLSWSDRPFELIVGTAQNALCFDNRLLPPAAFCEITKELETKKSLVFQNAKFDIRMMRSEWGFNVDKAGEIEDIEVLSRLERNDHIKYSLDAQAKRHGWAKGTEVEKYILKNKLYTVRKSDLKAKTTKSWHAEKVPIDIMSMYSLQDARLTYDLRGKHLSTLDPISVPVWEMEKKLTKVCAEMERVGLVVNEPYTRQALKHEEGLVHEAKREFQQVAGILYDNKKTTLVDIFKKAGEVIPKTAKGNDQLTDDDLESFTSPVAKLVQRIRFHEKRISTYYSSYLEFMQPDGVLHADIRQPGTTTGRFSYRDPNLQNIPSEEDSTDLFVARGCFKPRGVFVSMDYKQQEYRLMLAYARKRVLIEQVMGGMDVHQATADLVGISRYHAKTLNFAILYGAGVQKIALMLGCTVQEASFLKQKYFNALLEVEQLIFDVIKRGKARGYIYNWFGRKLHVNHRDFAYKFPNYLMQSGGADICKIAMTETPSILKNYDSKLVLQIHDDLIFDMVPEEMEELIPKLRRAMIDVFPGKNGMFMEVDVKYSKTSLAKREMQEWTPKSA